MATQVITEPMLLDSTGHGIIEGLEGIKNAVQPINIYIDIPITIPVEEWTASTPHQYTWTNPRITTECGIEVYFTEGSETVDMKYLEYEKILGGIVFEIDQIPNKPVPLMVRVINASATAVIDPIDAAMVETSAVPNTGNVEQALENHEHRLSSTGESINEIEETLENMDVDVKSRLKSVNGIYGDDNGNVIVNETKFAHQIITEDAQQSSGEFLFRTTGGDTSLSDGPAMLVAIMGRSIHTGEVSDSLEMQVNAIKRSATPNITAELNTETFIGYVQTEGVYTIVYTTEWNTNPSLYGITITNTPESGDSITVEWDGTNTPNMTVYSNHVAPDEITATIDENVFKNHIQSGGTYTLTYTDGWSEDPSLYGVIINNTPIYGDEIVITYVKSNRGIIHYSNPTAFVSTGWNLYDNSQDKKYARVKKYSSQYGFLIGGSYASIQFSESLNGSKTSISPASGYFTVPSDGYVWVTGGDDTTYIIMTWSDWTEGYEGTFQTYTESEVDLTDIMSNFSGGLFQVGTVVDEINFSTKRAISRIERLTYTPQNLEYAKSTGRAYDADTNYIYLEKEFEDVYVISENGAYIAYDHGNEYIVGGDAPVYIETLYGQNLVDKLRTDVVTKSNDIVDALTSEATDKALSALQGKILCDNLIKLSGPVNSAVSDLNDVTVTGIYSTGNTALNRPVDYCVVYVLALGSSTLVQLAFSVLDSKVYIRQKSNGTWKPWVSLFDKTSGVITKASGISDGTMDSMTLVKVGTTVFGSARLHSFTARPASGAFFNIPEGFRPPMSALVNGYMMVADITGNVSMLAFVKANGDVELSYSGSKTTNQVAFAGSWSVI